MLGEQGREFHFGQGTSVDQHFPQPLAGASLSF